MHCQVFVGETMRTNGIANSHAVPHQRLEPLRRASEFEAGGCNLDDLSTSVNAGGLDIQHHDPAILVLIDEPAKWLAVGVRLNLDQIHALQTNSFAGMVNARQRPAP